MQKKIKKIINILTWPCIFIISQFFIAFISFFVINLFLDNKSIIYNEIYILFTIILNFIILIMPIYFIKIKSSSVNKINIKEYIIIIFITIVYAVIWNLIFKNPEKNRFSPMFMISTCLVGPTLEELIYRKLLLEKLDKNQYLYTTIIFAISHLNIFKMVSSFCAGSLFYYFLNKYKSIYASVSSHITYNTICYLFMII